VSTFFGKTVEIPLPEGLEWKKYENRVRCAILMRKDTGVWAWSLTKVKDPENGGAVVGVLIRKGATREPSFFPLNDAVAATEEFRASHEVPSRIPHSVSTHDRAGGSTVVDSEWWALTIPTNPAVADKLADLHAELDEGTPEARSTAIYAEMASIGSAITRHRVAKGLVDVALNSFLHKIQTGGGRDAATGWTLLDEDVADLFSTVHAVCLRAMEPVKQVEREVRF
jgi:hypothetical protein